MKKFNLQTGKLGENIAKDFLEKKGYNIVEQNYKTKYGEIDIIAKKGGELIVVEVRTKIGDLYGTPEDSLTKKKLRKIWLNARARGADRIDAVCIVLNPDSTIDRINHYENIN
jgi:putative endonuclease